MRVVISQSVSHVTVYIIERSFSKWRLIGAIIFGAFFLLVIVAVVVVVTHMVLDSKQMNLLVISMAMAMAMDMNACRVYGLYTYCV